MAIAGVLVHCLKEKVDAVQASIKAMPDMTTYGIQQEQYVVVVAEAPATEMENSMERLDKIDGVLTVYTTYFSIEDELADAQLQVP